MIIRGKCLDDEKSLELKQVDEKPSVFGRMGQELVFYTYSIIICSSLPH